MSDNSSFCSRKYISRIGFYCSIYARYLNLDKIADKYLAIIVSDVCYSIYSLSNECISVIAKIAFAMNKGVCTKNSLIYASRRSINLNNNPKLYRY